MNLNPLTLSLNLNSIPRGSTREKFTIPLTLINWDIAEAVPVSEEAELRLEVRRTENEIIISGGLEATFRTSCARCLETVEFPVTEPVDRMYSWDPDMLTDTEVEPVSHNDGTVCILDPVREAVILSIPPLPLCDEKCRGLCPVCGENRNKYRCEHQAD